VGLVPPESAAKARAPIVDGAAAAGRSGVHAEQGPRWGSISRSPVANGSSATRPERACRPENPDMRSCWPWRDSNSQPSDPSFRGVSLESLQLQRRSTSLLLAPRGQALPMNPGAPGVLGNGLAVETEDGPTTRLAPAQATGNTPGEKLSSWSR
jgi:hypothetical protein